MTKKFNFICFALVAVILPSAASSVIAETAPSFFPATPPACAAMFDLPALDGRSRALAAESGRPILLHFFATWCEPCKAELGSLRRFSETRSDQIQVLAVNVGEVPGRVRRFLDETPVTFPVLLDADRAVAKSWAVEGLPATVVLDKNLTPRLAVTGDLDWTNTGVGREIDRALASTPDSRDANCTREATR